MTQAKRTGPPAVDAGPGRAPGPAPGHDGPASETDEAAAATRSADERETHLPASEAEALAASDTGERILERGLTRLPPG